LYELLRKNGAGEWTRTIDLLITNHHRAGSPASSSVLVVGNAEESFHDGSDRPPKSIGLAVTLAVNFAHRDRFLLNPQIKRTTGSRPPVSALNFPLSTTSLSLLIRPPVSACC
jgi:hypothetical protein